ncbi:hypothetical protein SKAU_G00297180 [Synaphobranchus kaupii]|uniref:Uncharacterized protein n=1 Tax=Synaphobranchus kaupii TaxID=118154 RepID=A0A9Q1EUY3_SYNKA|nr:hypothetical protein SKAU_G00297180 [Synaphobranchus kaupii]
MSLMSEQSDPWRCLVRPKHTGVAVAAVGGSAAHKGPEVVLCSEPRALHLTQVNRAPAVPACPANRKWVEQAESGRLWRNASTCLCMDRWQYDQD